MVILHTTNLKYVKIECYVARPFSCGASKTVYYPHASKPATQHITEAVQC